MPPELNSDTVVRWGPGLEATVNPSLDGSLRGLYVAQWVQPALVPVLRACLTTGDLFVDVGANIGVYTTWAAKLVGPTGSVLAFEPVAATRGWLERICEQNRLGWVEVSAKALGDAEGSAFMQTVEGASGLSKVCGWGLKVPIDTLDHQLGERFPALVKIDVEGYELPVLTGACRTLEASKAPVVFEAPDLGGNSDTVNCVRLLESIGYSVSSLTPRGLKAFRGTDYSHNLLAIHSCDQSTRPRLEGVRFPRVQNT